MTVLLRAGERRHEQRDGFETWFSFDPESHETRQFSDGSGMLEDFSEDRLSARSGAWHRETLGAEIVSYVQDGVVAYEDSEGRSGVLQAGEFEHAAVVRGLRQRDANASQVHPARLFRIRLRSPVVGLTIERKRKRFSVTERRGILRVVASPDGRSGSLRVSQDAVVYSALLEPGHHVVHQLMPGRVAWVHIVDGQGAFGDLTLTAGDGFGVVDEEAATFTAEGSAELLLVDLEEQSPPTRRSSTLPGSRGASRTSC